MKMHARSTPIIAFLTLACFFLVPATSRADNLVVNGDFEGASGTTVDAHDVQLTAANGLPGWTFTPASPSSNSYLLINSVDGYPGGGCCSAAFGGTGTTGTLSTYDEISQTLTTIPGQTYEISFYLQMDGGTPGDFQVCWDIYCADYPATTNGFDFAEFTYTYTGTAMDPTPITGTGSDTLAFYGYDDASYFELSDVSVTPTPEPSSIFLVLSGLAGLGETIRRKVRR